MGVCVCVPPFLLPLSYVLVSSDTTASRAGGSSGSSAAGDGGILLIIGAGDAGTPAPPLPLRDTTSMASTL
jgi:hypothetical protein